MVLENIKHIKIMYIPSQQAEPAPPLGTVLGNLGVNTTKFCESFNTFTSTLPTYFKIKVNISISSNRNTEFTVDLPSLGYILNLLKYEKIIQVKVFDRMNEKVISCISLYQLLKLCKFKLPFKQLKESFPIILGSIKSKGLVIVKYENNK
jgi:large subunit ribosomal protein L11